MGGEQIDYDMKFKLFLVTKLYNPHFRPEIAAQCTIINFIVTESGLEEQLLAAVVNIEKNELEMMRQELVKKQNEFSVTLDKLEESLLISLSEADQHKFLTTRSLSPTWIIRSQRPSIFKCRASRRRKLRLRSMSSEKIIDWLLLKAHCSISWSSN